MRVLLAALLSVTAGMASAWPASDFGPGPGGFATITVDYPTHGQQVPGPDMSIRLHSDNSRAAIHVLLDGHVIGADGRPLRPQPQDLNEVLQMEFRESPARTLQVRDLAPGLHTLEIRPGTRGTELPHINRQILEFVVTTR